MEHNLHFNSQWLTQHLIGLLLIGETFSDLLIAHPSLTTSLLAKTLSDWSTANPSLTTLSFIKMPSDALIGHLLCLNTLSLAKNPSDYITVNADLTSLTSALTLFYC